MFNLIGTVINSLSIIFGGLIGLYFKKGIKDNYKNTVMDAVALVIIVIGFSSALDSDNIILLIISLVIGSVIGEALELEKKLDNFGDLIQNKFKSKDSQISEGFITSSLIFCVGAMAIVGSLEAGIQQDYNTLYAKSILDGITALILSSTLGFGVILSAIPVFIYQASLTLLASSISPFITTVMINEVSAVGGILIIAIGITILDIKKISVANLLISMLIPVIYYLVISIV